MMAQARDSSAEAVVEVLGDDAIDEWTAFLVPV